MVQQVSANRYGNIVKDELQTCLDRNTEVGKTNVIEDEDFIVKFIETR